MATPDALPLAETIAHLEAAAQTGAAAALTQVDLQRMMTALTRLYAAKIDAEGEFPVAPFGALNATEVMVTAAALLESANVNVFELGFWQRR